MTRGLRNNNPGNIRLGKAKWRGSVTNTQERSFVTFSTRGWGYRALMKLLRNYMRHYACRNIRSIISRWAPEHENNTEAYVRSVSSQTGLTESELLQDDEDTLCRLAKAISYVENGSPAVDAEVQEGCQLLKQYP